MVTVPGTVLAAVSSSFLLLLSVVVALIKYQYCLLYQPIFLSFSYVSYSFTSIYLTNAFLRDQILIKFYIFFVLSLSLHLMEKFFTTVFNFNEFIFVYIVNIKLNLWWRNILSYLLTITKWHHAWFLYAIKTEFIKDSCDNNKY